jgi:translation initiation factor 3 subunit G
MTSRWADEIDEEDEQHAPQDIVLKDGERMVAEITTDPDTGKKKKITRTFKLEKKFVSKGTIQRKKWAKFGASKKDSQGPNSATTVVADEVLMQFLDAGKDEIQEENPFTKLANEGKGFVRCRYCNDNHFSAKCPYKDSGLSNEFLMPAKDLMSEDKRADSDAKPGGGYVPPALRASGNRRGESMMPTAARKDDATIRVSNLPESMSETDMQELCNPLGKVERIFLAKDRSVLLKVLTQHSLTWLYQIIS